MDTPSYKCSKLVAGRWSSATMVMGYCRGILVNDGAMAQKRASRGKK
ncbi:hypothetical protein [Aliivibrio finisterrensis]|nr:hypothetical protein [Aliivibrio finisterrensis]